MSRDIRKILKELIKDQLDLVVSEGKLEAQTKKSNKTDKKSNKIRKNKAKITKEQSKALKEKLALEEKLIKLETKLKKQTEDELKLAHQLLVADQNRIDALRLKQREDNKRLNLESQLNLQLEKDLELLKKIEREEKQRVTTLERNRNKLKLLQERVHSYGLELKKTAGGSDLLRKALKGDAIAFQKLSREIEKARKEQGKYDRAGVLTTRGTRNVHGSLSVLRSKLLLASFAFGGLTRISRTFTDASRDQEIAVKRVSSVIESQGFISGITTKQVEELASQLQATTGVTDELTLESSALLLSFQNIGKDIFPMAQKAVLDMTSALNQGRINTETLKTQSIQLAKALDNPVKGLNSLTRSGTTFDEQTKKQIKTLVNQGDILQAQTIILNEINKQYGNTASIDSFEKSSRALNSAIGDLNERVGDFMTPAIKEMQEAMTGFINSVTKRDLANLSASLGILSLAFVGLNRNLIKSIVLSQSFQKVLIGTKIGVVALLSTIVVKKILDFSGAFKNLSGNIDNTSKSINEIKEEISAMSDALLDAEILRLELKLFGTEAQKSEALVKDLSKSVSNIAVDSGVDNLSQQIDITNAGSQESIDLMKKIGLIAQENSKQLTESEKQAQKILLENTDLDKIKLETLKEIKKNKKSEGGDDPENQKKLLKSLKEKALVLQAEDDLQKELIQTQIDLGLTNVDISDASIEAIKNQIKLNHDLVESKKLLKEEEEQRLKDIEMQQEMISNIETENHNLRMQFLSEFSNAFFGFMEQRRAKELEISLSSIDNERNRINQSVMSEEQKQIKLEALDKKEDNLRKRSHNKSIDLQILQLLGTQAMSVAEIYMKSQVAKANAVATLPFPAFIPVIAMLQNQMLSSIGMALTSGAVGVAGLQAQKFQYGGLVGGNLHSSGGTMIEAERGEFVMSRNAVENFGVANMEAINNGSASPVNITFNNPVMSEDYTEDVIIPQIKRAVQRGADIGVS